MKEEREENGKAIIKGDDDVDNYRGQGTGIG